MSTVVNCVPVSSKVQLGLFYLRLPPDAFSVWQFSVFFNFEIFADNLASLDFTVNLLIHTV